ALPLLLAQAELAEHLAGAPDAGDQLLPGRRQHAGADDAFVDEKEAVGRVAVVVHHVIGREPLAASHLGQKPAAAPDDVHKGGTLAVHDEDQFLPRHGRPPSPGRGRGALVSAKRGLAFRQHEARLGPSPARSPAWPFASAKRSLALRQREAQLGPCPARSPGRRSACTRPSLAPRVRQALGGTVRPGPPRRVGAWPLSGRPPRPAFRLHEAPPGTPGPSRPGWHSGAGAAVAGQPSPAAAGRRPSPPPTAAGRGLSPLPAAAHPPPLAAT